VCSSRVTFNPTTDNNQKVAINELVVSENNDCAKFAEDHIIRDFA